MCLLVKQCTSRFQSSAERRERIRLGSSTPWDLFTYTYNRAGMLTQDRVTVGTHTLRHQYGYDRRGLLTTVGISHATTGSFSQILALDYDIAGAVTERHLGTQTSVPYAYDVAGRIHEIGDVTSTSDPFAALYSYTPSGLIARMDTRSGAAAQDCPYSSGVCTDYWRYNFSYDGLARLTTAQYQPMGGHMRGPGYSVSNLSYDSQGNIETLTRNAPTMPHPEGTAVDQLSYTYTARTNRLASVVDAVTTDLDWDAKPSTFQYNRAGSMTQMTESLPELVTRTTTVSRYDERQLPENLTIALTEGSIIISVQQVRYRYDANGQRISKWLSGSSRTERYVRDGMRLIGVFDENDNLKSWNIGGAAGLVGRADPSPFGVPVRSYYITDHLGSIRAVVNPSGTVIEARDYYPYGLTMPGRFYVQADTTREGYTGHELDRETGDYYAGARYYGSALGRWFVVDPMAEAYPGWSPYNYTMGNPVMLVDPDGMEADDDVDQVSAPRTTENFYPEDMFVYGMRNHPGARTPVVRVWEEEADDSTNTGQNPATQSVSGPCDPPREDCSISSQGATALTTEAILPFLYRLYRSWRAAMAARAAREAIARGTQLLVRSEAAGGHLIARHVGQTTQQMTTRLANNPRLSIVSTFRSVEQAGGAVSSALQVNASQVSTWVATGAHGRLTIQASFSGGPVLIRGASSPVPGTGVRVILQGSGRGNYHILTGFPIP